MCPSAHLFLSCFITDKQQLRGTLIFYLIISFVGSLSSLGIFPIILLPQVTILPNSLSTPPHQGSSFIQLLITFSSPSPKLSLRATARPFGFLLTPSPQQSLQGPASFFLPPKTKVAHSDFLGMAPFPIQVPKSMMIIYYCYAGNRHKTW